MSKEVMISFANGEWLPSEAVSIPVLDDFLGTIRGLRVFTTTLSAGLRVFHTQDHIDRLYDAMAVLGFSISYSKADILALLDELVIRNKDLFSKRPMALCMIASAGSDLTDGLLYIVVKEKPVLPERLLREGAILRTYPFERYMPEIKLTHYVGAHMARQAFGPEVDYPLFVSPDHHVLEGESFAVFFIKGNRIITPPVHQLILDSITRKITCGIVRKDPALSLEIRPVPVSEIQDMDASFLTSSLRLVMGITRIDETVFGHHPVLQELSNRFESYVEEYARTGLAIY